MESQSSFEDLLVYKIHLHQYRQNGNIPFKPLNLKKSNLKLPDSFNWVDEGAVNPPRDEKNCDASWAFSMAASIEGAYFKSKKTLENAQEILHTIKLNDIE